MTLSKLLAVLVSFAFLFPANALATKMYAVVGGDPQNGIPDSAYRYMDANEACATEMQVPPSTACERNRGPVFSALGSHPNQPSTCIYYWDCTCGTCQIGEPNDPRNFNKIPASQTNAYPKAALVCPQGTTEYLGQCVTDTPKCDACRPDPETWQGNPTNLASGNKLHREAVYRHASGSLELVLTYNSQAGATYFENSAFGRRWSSPYFVRVRDTEQGITAVQRGSGGEFQFVAPGSGSFYIADADVNDRLERIVDGSGQLLQWKLSSPDGDRVEEHDGPASLKRAWFGTLTRIRDRALREHTMTYSTASTPLSIAPEPGLLIAVTDHLGRQVTFTYDAKYRVVSMTDPAGQQYSFEYDGASAPANSNSLTKITFPDGKTRVFFYGEAAHVNGGASCGTWAPNLSNALTGIQDENGVRFATYEFGCDGRVTHSEHAGGVNNFTFTYGDPRVYVDPLGTTRSMGIARTLGVGYNTGTIQPSASGSGTVSNARTRDSQGNLASATDFNGNRTNYTYDLARNLETSRTEALTAAGGTTPQTRTISTQWHATFRLPTAIAEPLRITTLTYDPDGTQCGARGALCSKSIQATTDANGSQAFSATTSGNPRTWTYTYNANGDVLTVNGPRTDVTDLTTYTYYANNDADLGKRGRVSTITNAAGQTTSITAYNLHGQPLSMTDPNGLVTTMTYDARLRLKTRVAGSETTTYDYDFAGQLTKVTLPDGSFLSYTYDNAHRLTGMQDNLGNRVAYTLDNAGNRTQEQVYDPANQLAQTRSRVYNNLNRLFRELGAQSQTTEYAYDEQGNNISVKDPLNRVTSNQYDALNRLKQVTSPTPISAVTQYGYNGLDALTQVTDPRSLVTGYAVDGLGNLNTQTSPDTGTTANTYDAAGNLLTQTDAKNQVTTYTYDALNRVTLITFHDGSKQEYAYDAGTNGIGRLSSITEKNPANQVTSVIAYAYDQHGRVTSEARTVNGVAYSTAYRYDASGRMDRITYPSGRTVDYGFDAVGRIGGVITTPSGGNAQTVASSVAYHPFGGVKSMTLGNGQTYARSYDQDGRVSTYTLGGVGYTLGYDAASRIGFVAETSNPPNTNTYGYDELDRLISATLPASVYGYTYDAVGNRLTRSTGSTDTYAYGATSNRIVSITPASGPVRNFTLDANGSTTADGINTFAYDTRGRMVQAVSSLGTTTYQVNALGQRVRKTNTLGDTVYHYDRGGRLIAESTAAGVVKREYLYLGDIPLAVVVLP